MPNVRTLRPPYLWRRLAQAHFEWSHPDVPWLTPGAVYLLDSWIRDSDQGFEWGSGRSTIWLAKRARRMTSIEHDERWYRKVSERLHQSGLADRVDYRHIRCEKRDVDEPLTHPYAYAVEAYEDESIDWIIVDGKIRLTCMRQSLRKLKPGGLLVLDNAERFVPNPFDGKHTTVQQRRDDPKSENWRCLLHELKTWRGIHTSNGLWDTRCWVKPGVREESFARTSRKSQ